MDDNAIKVENLTKSWPGFNLDNISFTLPSGSILGLVGRNGAGKTTTIKLLSGILRKDGGEISILGMKEGEANGDIAVVLDANGLPSYFNMKETGRIMSKIYRKWDNEKFQSYIGRFSIPVNKAFKDFSLGMRKKAAIAVALSHSPSVLLLDEPTSGLDPVARAEILEILNEYTRVDDHSILISSHITNDLEKISDYIAFMDNGCMILFEEKDRLKEQWVSVHATEEELCEIGKDWVIGLRETPYGTEAIVRKDRTRQGMKCRQADIEEIFVAMVKEENK